MIMDEELLPDTENTQTQTQTSQVEWSQQNTPGQFPIIWGRLYLTKASLNGKHCWKINQNAEYLDLIANEFSLGRALSCTYVMKKEIIKENIIKNISKQHFVIQRDLSEPLNPAIITDFSYNGTFINGNKIEKGRSHVLDDNDEISVTHPVVKIFVFKDLLKSEQDCVPKEISKKYYISRTLGQGACGVVKLVYHKQNCTKHAIKIIKKCRLTNGQINHLNNPEKIMNEIKIMKALRHPCIISTEEVFDTRDTVYIIIELMQGGELFDKITKCGQLPEMLVKFMFRQMVLAVKYLHSQGITHRDLKPENVLLESKQDETIVKISDFGLSKFVGEDSFMKTMCGTPLYLAPEVLRANGQQSYGPEVDVWSLGVIFFVCLVGYLPFSSEYQDMSLRNQILTGRYKFSSSHWKKVSPQAQQLMKKMLTVPVNRRITLEQILNHSWMQDHNVIMKVEKLLTCAIQSKNMGHLTISNENDENRRISSENVTVLTVLATTSKRGLSDSFSSCEPIPKKLRLGMNGDKNNDTSATNSYCSDD